jgi:plastocyanin
MKAWVLAGTTALAIAGAIGFARAQQVVDQKGMQFSPTELTVKLGESVKFTNSDGMTHDLSVKAPDGALVTSTPMNPGDAVTVKFEKAGEYRVQCLIHPKMKMTVTAE